MSTEQNKSVVRRWIDEGWNGRNLAVADQVYAADYVQHEPGPFNVRSREEIKAYVAAYQAAFGDLHFEVDPLIAEGDKVVWRFVATGHHTGPLQGIPATGKTAAVSGICIFRMADSRIAEGWLNIDALGMLQAIGVIPDLAPAAA